MKKQKQLGFEVLALKNEFKSVKYFGGALLCHSNPKVKRPISTKKSMHLVLKSSLAKGSLSLLKHRDRIQKIIRAQAQKHGVKVYSQANAGNHLHLVVLPRSREAFQSFVRAVSGLIARLVLNVQRGKAKGIRFWDQRPFTRIVEWGREFKIVSNYLLKNTLEAFGFVAYTPRNHRYKLASRRATKLLTSTG